MGTTAQKLNKILETKEAIRTAINNKGGTLTTTDTFASYPSAIDSLPSGGGNTLKTLLDATQSAYNLFYQYNGTSVDGLISYSDTENVTNMSYMFYKCLNLTTIPQLNTSNVNNMLGMVNSCSNLTTISQLNTSKVTNMGSMFGGCYKLTKIDITHMNITSTSGNNFFAGNCYSLTKFIIRNMPTIPALSSNAFNKCYHFTGTTDSTYNPQGLKDGRIYVPDDKVYALKTATNWSVYADIIVPLSTLVE